MKDFLIAATTGDVWTEFVDFPDFTCGCQMAENSLSLDALLFRQVKEVEDWMIAKGWLIPTSNPWPIPAVGGSEE